MTEPVDSSLEQARQEIERLQRENEELRAREGHRGRVGWLRPTAVVVLMTLGFVLVPVSGLAVWTRNTLLDTDRYVETVAPLSDSQAVVDDVAAAVTAAIFERVDVEALLTENLPPELSFAAGPITDQVQSATKTLVTKALESDQFDVLWKAVNRQASASVVAFITGSDTDTVLQVKAGKLVLDLQPILEEVKTRLSDQGLDFVEKLPSVGASVELPVANVDYLVEARQLAKLLNTLAWLLPLLALLCFGGAIALSRNRRRSLVWSALLVSAGALVVGIALSVGRGFYIDSVTSDVVSADTATVVFDTVVRFLRNGIRMIFLLGVIVAFAAAVTGDAAWATKTRRALGGAVTQGGERSGLDTGGFGRFVAAHRTGLQIGTVGFFGVVLLLIDGPTPGTLLGLAIAVLAVLALIQFFAATAPRGAGAGEAGEGEAGAGEAARASAEDQPVG